jgi:hypothetical protein
MRALDSLVGTDHRRFVKFIAAVGCARVSAPAVPATSIDTNPGAPCVLTEITLPFSDLNETFLLSQNLSLDFIFAGSLRIHGRRAARVNSCLNTMKTRP